MTMESLEKRLEQAIYEAQVLRGQLAKAEAERDALILEREHPFDADEFKAMKDGRDEALISLASITDVTNTCLREIGANEVNTRDVRDGISKLLYSANWRMIERNEAWALLREALPHIEYVLDMAGLTTPPLNPPWHLVDGTLAVRIRKALGMEAEG